MENKFGIVNVFDDFVSLLINPKIYPLEVVYSASYVFLDRAYILLDGDPDKEIVVELRYKNSINQDKKKLEQLGRDFLNELLNYAFYSKRVEKNSEIRKILLGKALLEPIGEDEFLEKSSEDDSDNTEEIEDPEGIAIPWEEKYGASQKNEEKCDSCDKDCSFGKDDKIPLDETPGKD